jgi:hypothetical protein
MYKTHPKRCIESEANILYETALNKVIISIDANVS